MLVSHVKGDQLFIFDYLAHHVKEVVSKVNEDQRCSPRQLQVNHEASLLVANLRSAVVGQQH